MRDQQQLINVDLTNLRLFDFEAQIIKKNSRERKRNNFSIWSLPCAEHQAQNDVCNPTRWLFSLIFFFLSIPISQRSV